MTPLEKFNLMLQGGYNPMGGGINTNQMNDFIAAGYRKPFDNKPVMQNLFNTQEFSQDVANNKAQQDLLKKQNRGNMLIALGDALRGKDMTQGFLQRQELFKQKEDERKALENFNRMYATLDEDQRREVDLRRAGIELSTPKERRIVKGADGRNYYEDTREMVLPNVPISETSTEGERARTRLLELNSKPELTDSERSEIPMLKTIVYGEKEIIPFFNESGNVLNRVITNWDLSDDPNLTKKLSEQGYVTAGQKPSTIFSAQTNVGNEIGEKWENSTNTLNLINDLSKVLEEGRSSPSIAGALADVINTAGYQIKGFKDISIYQQEFPEEYDKRVQYMRDEHGSVLDKISADRGVTESIVMQLAYSLAKQNDPGGRLSDRDVDSAITIIGGSGANVDKRLATLKNLSGSIVRKHETYLDRIGRQYNNNQTIKDSVENFRDLPVFYNSTLSPDPDQPIIVGGYRVEVQPQ